MIISSALLATGSLLAHERALDERARLRSLKLLVRAPVNGDSKLEVREAIIKSTLQPRFSVVERAMYSSYRSPLGLGLSVPPHPESLRGARGAVIQVLGSESLYELSLIVDPAVIDSRVSNPNVSGQRSRLVIRFRARGLWPRVSDLIGGRWWPLAAQALVLLAFALYLSQEWLVSPLARLVELTQLLRERREGGDALHHRTYQEREVQARSGSHRSGSRRSGSRRSGSHGPVDTSRELYALRRSLIELSDELRREQRTLAQAHQALQSRERLVTAGYISARVMHELGNPLSSVSGIIEFLRDEPEVTPDHRALLELAFEELGRARDTTRVIRRVTRISNETLSRGGTQNRGRPLIALHDITEWLSLMLRYHERSMSVELLVTGELERSLSIDLDSLRYALLNLALNAAQAQGGMGALWLAVSPRPHASSGAHGCQFTLSDEGPGLDPDWLEVHLAGGSSQHPTVGSSAPHEGVGGLGLLIARDAVESWGGSLWMLREGERAVHGRAEREDERSYHERFCGARFAVWVPSVSLN